MTYPPKYSWLSKIGALPKTIAESLPLIGVQEIVGKGSNKTIMAWRDELNLAGVKITGYGDDDIPWCGLFAAIIAYRRMNAAAEVVKDPLWARNWAKYGTKSAAAGLGDVLVFVRNGGGHVGFYVAEDSTAYHVIGGNQGNKVSVTRIAKDRCIAVRRPPYSTVPSSVKPYHVKAAGDLSANEA
jgi:uncharacterized protein (TIGR02594 family)